MKRFRLLCVGFALAAMTAMASAQDAATFSLKRVVKVGDSINFKLQADLDIAGGTATFTADVNEKVVSVQPNGDYDVESNQSNAKVNFNGQEMDAPQGGPQTTTYNANGEILDIKGEQADQPGARRVANLGIVKSPDQPVKVGDTWTYKIDADSKTGAVAATAEYKVEDAEKVGDRDTVKVSYTVKETEGSDPASNQGATWFDAKDFSTVKGESTWTNVPIPGAPGPVSGKVTLTRVD